MNLNENIESIQDFYMQKEKCNHTETRGGKHVPLKIKQIRTVLLY